VKSSALTPDGEDEVFSTGFIAGRKGRALASVDIAIFDAHRSLHAHIPTSSVQQAQCCNHRLRAGTDLGASQTGYGTA